jgi:hypothetical protein
MQAQSGLRLAQLVAVLLLATTGGCTRNFYLRQADREVADILAEKDKYPEWKIEQYHVYPDPRARFANPANPNRQPMPPDDEAAWRMSPHPQHPPHAGIKSFDNSTYLEMIKAWDAQNRAEREAALAAGKKVVENVEQGETGESRTGPLQLLYDEPLAQSRGFLVDMPQTIELGVINSREYQFFREDLYLEALPVTQQRFSFAWQWMAIENWVRQWAGPDSSAKAQNNWTGTSTVGVSKLFSTGALLTASFANKLVFDFQNAGRFSTQSTVNLDIVQPLLQGGGKAVTLEPLTQAERNLFYSIRAYAHFREQFYTDLAFGGTIPSTLAAAAGATSGPSPISTLAALGIASTDVAGQFRGYLPSLYRQLDMAVDRKYVKDLEKALLLFEGFQEGGQVAPLQVDQVKSTLLQARNAVLKDVQDTTNALDQFKLQIGIPANVNLILDDTPSRPITRTLDRYYGVFSDSEAAFRLIEKQDSLEPEKLRPLLKQLYTRDPLVRGTSFQRKLPGSWDAWARATDMELRERLEKLGQERRKLLDTKTDAEMKGQQLSPEDARRLSDAEFESDVGSLEQILRRFEAKPWEFAKTEQARREDRIKLYRLVTYAAQIVLVWARNERVAQVGQSWPTLPLVPIEGIDLLILDPEKGQEAAIQIALRNRWDLMNARAQVVDSWRQLAVTANALLGVVNVQYHLDSTTPPGGTRPLAFSNAGTNSELIINGQLPLVRVAERNAYRTALINYERARRALISLEDTIAAQVRFDVRQLHLFAENFKIQQKVLESLYSQVENSLEVIVAPADPDQLKASGTTGQANAAALTNQYLGALGSLNGAQTKMYDIWLSYLATRMQLYQDMERLPLDARGVWIDELSPDACLRPNSGVTHQSRPQLLPPVALGIEAP